MRICVPHYAPAVSNDPLAAGHSQVHLAPAPSASPADPHSYFLDEFADAYGALFPDLPPTPHLEHHPAPHNLRSPDHWQGRSAHLPLLLACHLHHQPPKLACLQRLDELWATGHLDAHAHIGKVSHLSDKLRLFLQATEGKRALFFAR